MRLCLSLPLFSFPFFLFSFVHFATLISLTASLSNLYGGKFPALKRCPRWIASCQSAYWDVQCFPPSATSSSSFCSPRRFLHWAKCRWPRPAITDLRGILAGVVALCGSREREYHIRDLVTWAALLPTRSSHNFAMRGNLNCRTCCRWQRKF